MKTFKSNKRAYAIFRAGIAIDRMIATSTAPGKRQAAKWATAWGVAAGALVPQNFRLRTQRPYLGKKVSFVRDEHAAVPGMLSR